MQRPIGLLGFVPGILKVAPPPALGIETLDLPVVVPVPAVLPIGEAGVYAIAPGLAAFACGHEPDLSIPAALVIFHDAPDPFLTGLLRTFSLAHQLPHPKASDRRYHV